MPNSYHISSENNFALYNGDSVEICSNLPEKSVDCIFADPPYFLSKGFTIKTKSGYVRDFDKGDWDKMRSREEVHEFNYKWISSSSKSNLRTISLMWRPACLSKTSKYSILSFGKNQTHRPLLQTNGLIFLLNISSGHGKNKRLHTISITTL